MHNNRMNPVVGVLFLIAFAMNIAIHMMNFGIVFFFTDFFQFTPSLVGILYAAGSVSYLAACLLLGRFIVLLPPRFSVGLAVFVMGGMLTLIRFSTTAWVTIGAFLIMNMAMSFLWPPLMGWISLGIEGPSLGRILGLFNVNWSSGALLGPFFGGWLVERSPLAAFQVGMAVVAGVFLLVFVSRFFFPAPASGKTETDPAQSQGRETSLRYVCWIGIFSSYFLAGITLSIFPLFIRDLPGADASTSGLMLFTRGVFTTLTFWVLGKMTRWHFKRRIVLLVQGGLVLVAFLLIYNRSLLGYYPLMALLGILFAVAYAESVFHGVSGSSSRQQRMGIHEAVLTGGTLVGSSFSGYIYQHFSMGKVFFGAAVILAGLLCFQGFFLWGTRKQFVVEGASL